MMLYAYVTIAVVTFVWILFLNRREQMPIGKKFLWALLWPLTALMLVVICVYLLWGKKR